VTRLQIVGFTQPEAATLSREEREDSLWCKLDYELREESWYGGKPRLHVARKILLDETNLQKIGLESFAEALELGESLFSSWRDFSEFILLRKTDLQEEKSDEFLAVKCSKRGNDVYARRIKMRLSWLNREIPNKHFFKMGDFDTKKVVTTSLLWITLTWDTKRCSLVNAWESHIGRDFNKFMAALRSKFGRVSYFRVWEAYESGYPHIHVIVYFHDKNFQVLPHVGPNEGITYRIPEVKSVSSLWHSFVDVQAISSLRNVFTYIKKHQEKIILGLSGSIQEGDKTTGFDLDQVKGLRTLFLCWIFRKRSFSVSGDFREVLSDLISHLHNSNMVVQMDLFGEVVLRWKFTFLGVFSGEELGLPPWIWTKHLDKNVVSDLLEQRERYGV
jgi:hypothetical protein